MSLTGFARSLSWQDFPAVDASDGDEAAFTQARFRATWGRKRVEGGVEIGNLVVAISFIRSDSWVVRGAQTTALLAHEQGHYDLVALGGRDLHIELAAGVTGSDGADLDVQVNAIIARWEGEVAHYNELFDDRTAHGTNASQEQVWIGRIRSAKASPTGSLSSLVPQAVVP